MRMIGLSLLLEFTYPDSCVVIILITHNRPHHHRHHHEFVAGFGVGDGRRKSLCLLEVLLLEFGLGPRSSSDFYS